MHKGVILLTKASDKEEALEKVESFMEQYGDGDVWDWYQVGGRWQNELAPKELKEKFYEVIKTFLKQEKFGITQQEIDKNAVKLQNTWENLGLKGTNPYADHYSLKAEGNAYDVLPLNECLPTVKDWVKDRVKEKEKCWEKLLSAKEKADNGEYDMSGYYAGIYRDLDYGNFSFECNVFNIDDYDSESIPEDIEGWWAIMVDMHN